MNHKQLTAASERREKIAKLWSKGLSRRQIAERTGYSYNSVKQHVAAVTRRHTLMTPVMNKPVDM